MLTPYEVATTVPLCEAAAAAAATTVGGVPLYFEIAAAIARAGAVMLVLPVET